MKMAILSYLIIVHHMNTLKRDILNAGKNTPTEAEDINVEHAQLLLFLFHTLPLMQKKSLLLQLAQVWFESACFERMYEYETGFMLFLANYKVSVMFFGRPISFFKDNHHRHERTSRRRRGATFKQRR